MPKVFVIDCHGCPLMPCNPSKARRLLRDGKAKVKHRTPFTIQLLYGSSGYKQPVILGVDAGSKTVGLSASTGTEELFAAEMKLRNDVVDNLSTRRGLRRARRNRKTRYRKARFNNRVHSKHKGWLAPSVEVKIQEHITVIKRICSLLPITKVVVETAEFDLQLLKAILAGEKAPEGEDYQKARCMDTIMSGSMYFGGTDIPVNAAGHILRQRNLSSSTSTIWRAARSAVMPRTI